MSGVASKMYVLLFSGSTTPNDVTFLFLSGDRNSLLQHSFIQAIWGEPASCTVPSITIEASVSDLGLAKEFSGDNDLLFDSSLQELIIINNARICNSFIYKFVILNSTIKDKAHPA